MGAHRDRELAQRRIDGRLAVRNQVEPVAISIERRDSRSRVGIAFVRDIVSTAGEAIDRHDRGPETRGNEARCDRKILVVTDSQR